MYLELFVQQAGQDSRGGGESEDSAELEQWPAQRQEAVNSYTQCSMRVYVSRARDTTRTQSVYHHTYFHPSVNY